MKLVTAAQMKAIDREAIDKLSIPSADLMENAGSGIALEILSDLVEDPRQTSVAVFCGKGNNGGDGYVVARLLDQAGLSVRIFFLGPIGRLSADARLNFDRAVGQGLSINEVESLESLPEELESDLIIDAIFGTGFEGTPNGLSADLIAYINRQEIDTVSIDLPSGLNGDNGQHEGAVVDADCTYTLAQPKYGLYISPGRELSGLTETISIGIPDEALESFDLPNELISPEQVVWLMPERPPDAHKGSLGKLCIVAGSTGMTGAASMAGQAAMRSGAGLVKIACPKTVLPIVASKLTEVMTHPLPDVARKGALALRGLGELGKLVEEYDALVIGPGLGQHHETAELVRRLVGKLCKPAVIDADGLNALAGHTDLIADCKSPLVLTPHAGEFYRLTGETLPDDFIEKSELVRQVATDLMR
ncbi:MAG: NAD(P)H-hydrate epimerase [candidate division Zixibacteria bacterium]